MTESLKTSPGKVLGSALEDEVREIGHTAVWSLSSCKAGFGVEQLLDDNLVNYWQSDGPQPHLINVQFRKRTTVRFVSIYTDYKSDESYTPSKISVRIGNDPHDLRQIELLELGEPSGWINIELGDVNNPVKTFMIQIAVLQNHQNGRDTHLRLIKIYAPKHSNFSEKIPTTNQLHSDLFAQFATIR